MTFNEHIKLYLKEGNNPVT